MDAIDVLMRLVNDDLQLPRSYSVELIEHEVGENWRERYRAPRRQVAALPQSLVHDGPFQGTRVPLSELEQVARERIREVDAVAISVCSRVWDVSGRQVGHLPIMNLHPVGFRSDEQVRLAVRLVVDGRDGYLLKSGRYLHFYGAWLLGTADWHRFLAQFLMPCVLVSPRYVGHSLYRRFCSLRLNAVPPFKPSTPTLLVAPC